MKLLNIKLLSFKHLLLLLFSIVFLNTANATSSAMYVNDMDYVIGDVKQGFVTNKITTNAHVENLLLGFKTMNVNAIRIPIFAEGLTPNKEIFDYFYDRAVEEGFRIFANPAQHSGGQRIACEIFDDNVCDVLDNNNRTTILIDRIIAFAEEYPSDWINPFDIAKNINVATSHNLGYDHASWPTFIELAKSLELSVWDSEAYNNIFEAKGFGVVTRLQAAIEAGVDGLVLSNSWVNISLTDGSVNNAGQTIMGFYLKFRTDKTYYIQNIGANKRLAADGASENAYGTPIDTTGADVEWVFIDNGNGYFHIRRAAGGSLPGLRIIGSQDLADMEATNSNNEQTYFDFSAGAKDGYFITLPDWENDNEPTKLQITTADEVKFVTKVNKGSSVSYHFIEAGDYESTESSSDTVVHIRNRNLQDFAIDGNRGGASGQSIYLLDQDEKNVNQQWVEINRGDEYYSYQKQGTNFCIDGGNWGSERQPIYLWQCAENNENQHWRKQSTDSGFFKLIKRNAVDFAINGETGQNVNLLNTSNTSFNLQWSIR